MAWKYDKSQVPAPIADVVVTNPRTSQQLSVEGCLVDTGSAACWLRKSDIDGLGQTTNHMRSASVPGVPKKGCGMHLLALQVWGRTFEEVWVMALPPDSAIGPVLGRDVINKLDLTLKGPDQGYEVADRTD